MEAEKIKNVLVQLDPKKKREKKIIDLLDNLKKEGTGNKEAVMVALENSYDLILTELKEIKQILLFSGRTPVEDIYQIKTQKKKIESIEATDDEITSDEAESI